MAALPMCGELRRSVNSPDWEPSFILYYQRAMSDDVRLARLINTLCDTVIDVINGRWRFIRELDMLDHEFVPRKMAEFIKETSFREVCFSLDLCRMINVCVHCDVVVSVHGWSTTLSAAGLKKVIGAVAVVSVIVDKRYLKKRPGCGP
nr:hypothetical protein [Tanacetum cinerariifolium]